MASVTEYVLSEESVSVDIQKIKHIHKITGSQYLPKFRLSFLTDFSLFDGKEFSRRTVDPGWRCYEINSAWFYPAREETQFPVDPPMDA